MCPNVRLRIVEFQSSLRRYWPTVALFATLLGAWQLAVRGWGCASTCCPRRWRCCAPPSAAPLDAHLWITTLEIVGAFFLAAGVGVALGIAHRVVAAVASALVPFLVFVNTLPKVAVAPLFLLWLGYGIVPNMLIGALIGFFPVVINTAVGLTPGRRGAARPRARLRRAEVEGVRQDPHPERATRTSSAR